MFYTTFPFHLGPSFIIIVGKLGKYGLKIHLSVAEGPESSGTIDPVLVSSIYTLLTGRIELCIFNMKHFNAFMIMIDVREIVQALKNKMARVVQEACSFMLVHF